jgi:DMSO/TMAO reductase YedYZ molybdopterin-dependent catalytic subunit
MTLPPGQRPVDGFQRFGTHLSRPAPVVPVDPVLEIRGAVAETFDVPLSALATLPRRELTADFHCVAGWSATNLRWEGVSFRDLYATFVRPALPPGTTVTHVVFRGLGAACLPGQREPLHASLREGRDRHPATVRRAPVDAK